MLAVNLSKHLEKQFFSIVQDNYEGDYESAIIDFIKLHKKYGWKEQLLKDVKSVRSEIKKQGGINQKKIDTAIKNYRSQICE
ncbi:MAG: hypothetical protein HQK77_16895 [Desulfobacterales bacterium]|nr:hypothetical protein [Desulfobacterales bacterium]